MPENMKIGTLLYTIYWNFVFDLTYVKIKYGNLFFLKTISPFKIIKKLFFLYFGISYFMFKLILQIFKINKEKSIEKYLYNYTYNPLENRMIVRINNKWKTNGGWEVFKKSLNQLLTLNFKYENPNKINKLYKELKPVYDKMEEFGKETKAYSAIFVDKKLPKTPHLVFPESTNEKNILAYQTSYQAAYDNHFYKKIPLIKEYDGSSKKSTLIPKDSKDLKQIRDETNESKLSLIVGAYFKGYDKKLISKEWNNDIEKVEIIHKEIVEILVELDWYTEDRAIEIIANMSKCIDDLDTVFTT